MKVRIGWINYLKLYRVYNAENPQRTIVYEDNKEEMLYRLKEEGYEYSFDNE